MPVELKGSTSGSVTLAAPAVAGSNTVTLPAVTGTAVISGQNSAITAMTSVSSSSGTAFDFTGIPSWVKRITVIFQDVSLSGTDDMIVQLGTSGGLTTSGYTSAYGYVVSGVASNSSTAGLVIGVATATRNVTSVMHICNISSNTWVASYGFGNTAATGGGGGGGFVALGGTLTQLRITRTGTNTFDNGTINVLYE